MDAELREAESAVRAAPTLLEYSGRTALALHAFAVPASQCACVRWPLQIRRMDMEARSLAPDKSRPLLIKVKDYKADLLALKEQLKKSGSEEASGSAAARAELVRHCSPAAPFLPPLPGFIRHHLF